ncbi:MAG: hypothetical protein ABI333_16655 [bacterium]
MSHSVQIALVALVALLVGASLPLLWSAFLLLRRARETLTVLETQTRDLGARTAALMERVEHIAVGVEKELPTLRRTAERVDGLGSSLEQLTETVRKIQAFTAIIGPALAAGVQAFRAVQAVRTPAAEGEADPLPEAVSDAILAKLQAQAAEQSDPPPDSAGE